MKNADYRNLINTARTSSYFDKPTEQDEALKGLIAYGVIATLILTFVVAVIVSYFGAEIEGSDVGMALGVVMVMAIVLLVFTLAISNNPKTARGIIGASSLIITLIVAAHFISDSTDARLVFVPLFFYSSIISWVSFKQMFDLNQVKENVSGDGGQDAA